MYSLYSLEHSAANWNPLLALKLYKNILLPSGEHFLSRSHVMASVLIQSKLKGSVEMMIFFSVLKRAYSKTKTCTLNKRRTHHLPIARSVGCATALYSYTTELRLCLGTLRQSRERKRGLFFLLAPRVAID